MSVCHACGGTLAPAVADLDVSRTPMLSGLMLACSGCGRPIRLLHHRRLSGGSRARERQELNRALRAARRRKRGMDAG